MPSLAGRLLRLLSRVLAGALHLARSWRPAAVRVSGAPCGCPPSPPPHTPSPPLLPDAAAADLPQPDSPQTARSPPGSFLASHFSPLTPSPCPAAPQEFFGKNSYCAQRGPISPLPSAYTHTSGNVPDSPPGGLGHMNLVGYTDRLTAAPGDTVRFMVSSQHPRFRADLVRLIHGDESPRRPRLQGAPGPPPPSTANTPAALSPSTAAPTSTSPPTPPSTPSPASPSPPGSTPPPSPPASRA